MLGSWRDGKIVPYDSDVDVLVNHDEVPKLLRGVDRPFNDSDYRIHLNIHQEYQTSIEKRNMYKCSGKRLVSGYTDQCSPTEPLGRLIKGPILHIDLFGYKVINNTAYFQTTDKINKFPLDMILPYSKCKLAEFNTFCPRKPYDLLKFLYNNKLEPIRKCKQRKWV